MAAIQDQQGKTTLVYNNNNNNNNNFESLQLSSIEVKAEFEKAQQQQQKIQAVNLKQPSIYPLALTQQFQGQTGNIPISRIPNIQNHQVNFRSHPHQFHPYHSQQYQKYPQPHQHHQQQQQQQRHSNNRQYQIHQQSRIPQSQPLPQSKIFWKSTFASRVKSHQEGGLFVNTTAQKRHLIDDSSSDEDHHQDITTSTTLKFKSKSDPPTTTTTHSNTNTNLYNSRNVHERRLNKLPPNAFIRYNDDQAECLVPIRLDFELKNGVVFKDMFSWNMSDYTMTPKRYAEILVFDLDIPSSYVDTIASSIQSQLDFYSPFAFLSQPDSHLNDNVDDSGNNGGDVRMVPVQIEVQIGKRLIRDKFIWDLSQENKITPEDYARIFAREYGLGGDNVALIASCVREQILLQLQSFNADPHSFISEMQNSFISSGSGISGSGSISGGVTLKNQLGKTMVIDELSREQLLELSSKQERQSRRLRRETARLSRRR